MVKIIDKECQQINQTEYKRIKRYDPKNVNGYTARLGFKYFKLFPKEEILKLNMLQIVANKPAEMISEINKINT